MEKTYQLPFKFRSSIEIADIDDFNCVGQDMTEAFAESMFSDDRYTESGENPLGVYLSYRGIQLLDRYQTRLYRLAEKIFNEAELDYFDVSPHNVIEE